MYGCPFLLENLPPTDPAPLADYQPYLNLLRELLREHAEQIMSHPITISIKPGDLFLLNDPHNTHHCQAQQDPPVAEPLKDKTPQTLTIQQRMSTLAYCWAPHSYASPTNSLPPWRGGIAQW
jgi:hypothetical protein